MTRQMMIAANWKMHGTTQAVQDWLSVMEAFATQHASLDVVLAPTYVHLSAAMQASSQGVKLAAQNVSDQPKGAFTGEISATMLRECGCHYVIIGHSERRQLFYEDAAVITRKVLIAQQQGLIPILCVGETAAEREQGQAVAVIEKQLLSVLSLPEVKLDQLVIAYEPVWAIGTGQTASPEDAESIHAAIRAMIATLNEPVSRSMKILYGGSVKPQNALSLFSCSNIDGGLVGGASLDADAFREIGEMAVKAKLLAS